MSNDYQEEFTLYHGTSETNAKKILKEGLLANSCLTNLLDHAEYYASEATAETNDKPVVLSVHIHRNDLRADFDAYANPRPIYYKRIVANAEQWHDDIEVDNIPYPTGIYDIEPCLHMTNCVINAVTIPASDCKLN